MSKAIDHILTIDKSEKQCNMIKGMLQSSRLKYHMNTFGIEKSLSNRPSVELKCLNNIKYIYKHAGKYDNQKMIKVVIDATMVSTPEESTYVSPSFYIT